MARRALPQWKEDLLEKCTEAECLSFGTFTLKSGRQSPYFFNAGLFYTRARLVRSLSTAFAKAISEHRSPPLQFDVLLPAYKGIPLAAITVNKLADEDVTRFGDVGCAFNRKEVKTYGDGGSIIGASLKGKRVLIIDDVITAGTAINEAVEIIKREGGNLVGVVVALDRMEKMPSAEDVDGVPGPSAIGEVRRKYGVPVLAVLNLNDIIDGLRAMGDANDVARLEEYRIKYRSSD